MAKKINNASGLERVPEATYALIRGDLRIAPFPQALEEFLREFRENMSTHPESALSTTPDPTIHSFNPNFPQKSLAILLTGETQFAQIMPEPLSDEQRAQLTSSLSNAMYDPVNWLNSRASEAFRLNLDLGIMEKTAIVRNMLSKL